jgi:hypothetical protein
MRRASVSCTDYDFWKPTEDHLFHRLRDLSRRGIRLNVSWPVLKRREGVLIVFISIVLLASSRDVI